MQQNKFFVLLLVAMLGLAGCIERYIPNEILESEENYVIWGRVTNNRDYHLVKVTKTSSLEYPRNMGVMGCEVAIVDSDNNTYISEYGNYEGEYYVNIEPELITVGKAFKVIVKTPDGIEIESAYDTIRPCPEIKDLYVQRVDKPTTDPNIMERGVQFKVDLDADDSFGRYFNWEMEVTFEYRSAFPLTHYFDGEIHELPRPDYSMYYCWQTEQIKDFFPLSTNSFDENRFTGHNLHFVNNRTQRLLYQYSVLLFQSAINEGYFNFLDDLRRNSTDQEGLFGAQPIGVRGNLHSTNKPETNVLGYFSAENVQSRRFFFSNVMDVPFEIPVTCIPYMPLNGFASFHPNDYPIYMAIGQDGSLGVVGKSCVDCRKLGGSTQKPSYWP
jgi:hypothetical protein